MGLFSTLASSLATESGTSTSASTLAIPTVIQLFTRAPLLEKTSSKSRSFAALSYQAVRAASSAAEADLEGGALLSKQQKETASLHPNLGVWNCRVAKGRNTGCSADQQPLVDQLLRTIPSSSSSPPTFCFTVDLSNPYEVEPSLSLLQNALVRFLIAQQPSEGSAVAEDSHLVTRTTSLYQLRATNFGLAVQDEESMSASPNPNEADRKTRVALIISAVLPAHNQETDNPAGETTGSSSGGYKEKQAEALVLYHLRKYASSLNAILCFVRQDEPLEGQGQSHGIAAMSLNHLSWIWNQLAQGKEVWKEEELGEGTDQETSIYGPGMHHEDLIESVLLRNAQYPGQWDASKDSLWVALRGGVESSKENTEENTNTSGDEDWLSELRASVASEIKTPPPSASKGDSSATAKTPNDAAVSSFFESLLS